MGLDSDMPSRSATPRTILMVLGMHRSGTSALAGVLNRLGAAMPADTMPASADNVKGYYEPTKIVEAHDRMLMRFGRFASREAAWSDWATDLRGAFSSPEADGFVEDLAGLIEQEYGGAGLVLVKDPRACLLVPVWQRVAARLGAELRAVLPVRDPHEVARSLSRRAHSPMLADEAYLAWLRHVLDAERWSRGVPRAFVSYPALLADWRGAIAMLCAQAALALPERTPAMEREVDGFLDTGLRHQSGSASESPPGAVLAGWLAAVEAASARLGADPSNREAMAGLDRVSAEFEGAVAALGPALIACRERLEAALAERNRLARELAEARERRTTEAALHEAVAGRPAGARPGAGLLGRLFGR